MPDTFSDKVKDIFGRRKIRSLEDVHLSQAFCMKPWVHLFVSHFGTVVPCCLTSWEKDQALGDVNKQSIEEIWQGPEMQAFRRKMLRDQPDARCHQCYQNEKLGLRSARKVVNFLYADQLDWVNATARSGFAPDAKPIYWDIRFSNLCNFRCRICGHHSSSNWFDDAKAMGQVSHETRVNHGVESFDDLLGQLEVVIPDLQELYFAGGEPLIMEEHYKLLKHLLKRGKTDVRLRYNTNFSQTHYKGQDVFDLWNEFEDVFVHASLDGEGKRGEFQRKGQDWNQVLENRRRMREKCPQVDFLLTPTISIFNVLHLPDFHRNWTESGLIHLDECMPHTLKQPAAYSLRVLPPPLKAEVATKLQAHIDWIVARAKTNPPPPPPAVGNRLKERLSMIKAPHVTGHIKLDMAINEFRKCINFMNSGDDTHLLPEFRALSAQLDTLREENTQETFPELAPLFVE
ncbi:MAG TPA: twitch domain-containing radical SAM protein [Bacteroidetes bacterium]|nr:twitch domain-containing radical SAM protein [Bacteroidota bacterium]